VAYAAREARGKQDGDAAGDREAAQSTAVENHRGLVARAEARVALLVARLAEEAEASKKGITPPAMDVRDDYDDVDPTDPYGDGFQAAAAVRGNKLTRAGYRSGALGTQGRLANAQAVLRQARARLDTAEAALAATENERQSRRRAVDTLTARMDASLAALTTARADRAAVARFVRASPGPLTEVAAFVYTLTDVVSTGMPSEVGVDKFPAAWKQLATLAGAVAGASGEAAPGALWRWYAATPFGERGRTAMAAAWTDATAPLPRPVAVLQAPPTAAALMDAPPGAYAGWPTPPWGVAPAANRAMLEAVGAGPLAVAAGLPIAAARTFLRGVDSADAARAVYYTRKTEWERLWAVAREAVGTGVGLHNAAGCLAELTAPDVADRMAATGPVLTARARGYDQFGTQLRDMLPVYMREAVAATQRDLLLGRALLFVVPLPVLPAPASGGGGASGGAGGGGAAAAAAAAASSSPAAAAVPHAVLAQLACVRLDGVACDARIVVPTLAALAASDATAYGGLSPAPTHVVVPNAAVAAVVDALPELAGVPRLHAPLPADGVAFHSLRTWLPSAVLTRAGTYPTYLDALTGWAHTAPPELQPALVRACLLAAPVVEAALDAAPAADAVVPAAGASPADLTARAAARAAVAAADEAAGPDGVPGRRVTGVRAATLSPLLGAGNSPYWAYLKPGGLLAGLSEEGRRDTERVTAQLHAGLLYVDPGKPDANAVAGMNALMGAGSFSSTAAAIANAAGGNGGELGVRAAVQALLPVWQRLAPLALTPRASAETAHFRALWNTPEATLVTYPHLQTGLPPSLPRETVLGFAGDAPANVLTQSWLALFVRQRVLASLRTLAAGGYFARVGAAAAVRGGALPAAEPHPLAEEWARVSLSATAPAAVRAEVEADVARLAPKAVLYARVLLPVPSHAEVANAPGGVPAGFVPVRPMSPTGAVAFRVAGAGNKLVNGVYWDTGVRAEGAAVFERRAGTMTFQIMRQKMVTGLPQWHIVCDCKWSPYASWNGEMAHIHFIYRCDMQSHGGPAVVGSGWTKSPDAGLKCTCPHKLPATNPGALYGNLPAPVITQVSGPDYNAACLAAASGTVGDGGGGARAASAPAPAPPASTRHAPAPAPAPGPAPASATVPPPASVTRPAAPAPAPTPAPAPASAPAPAPAPAPIASPARAPEAGGRLAPIPGRAPAPAPAPAMTGLGTGIRGTAQPLLPRHDAYGPLPEGSDDDASMEGVADDPRAGSLAPIAPAGMSDREVAVQAVMEMGFDRDTAERALIRCQWDVEEAANSLLESA